MRALARQLRVGWFALMLAGCGGRRSGGHGAAPVVGGSGNVSEIVCPAEACPDGQECCLASGQCAQANGGDCPAPSMAGASSTSSTPCSKDSQCGADEQCGSLQVSACVGGGVCRAKTSCEQCMPEGAPECQVCGCDGVSYESPGAACAAGVRIASHRACGELDPQLGASTSSEHPPPSIIGCALDQQCPSGQDCCRVTGTCYDPACAGCCQIPPAGARFPCEDDTQCFADFEFCDGPGCAGPGGCFSVPSAGCPGDIQEVCGCDGKTYVNRCWAQAARARVAKLGRCP